MILKNPNNATIKSHKKKIELLALGECSSIKSGNKLHNHKCQMKKIDDLFSLMKIDYQLELLTGNGNNFCINVILIQMWKKKWLALTFSEFHQFARIVLI